MVIFALQSSFFLGYALCVVHVFILSKIINVIVLWQVTQDLTLNFS